MRKTTKIIAAGISTIALAGGVGVGIASADPSTSPTPTASPTASPTVSPSPTTTAKPKAEANKHRDLTRRALHGEATLGGKKSRVVVFQRGTLDQVSATSITVKSTDDFTATYVVTDTTKIRKAKAQIAAGDLKTGDRVRVRGVKDGATTTATRIVAVVK